MTPDKVQARKMVLVGAFLLLALAVYRHSAQGTSDPSGAGKDVFHALWGVGIVSLALSILADFAPTIAGPFAMLTVLGSLASGDVSIIDRVFGSGAGGSTPGRAVANPSRPASPAGTTPAGGTR